MANTPEEIQKSLKLYALIGLALFVGTSLTVAVAVVPWMDVGARGFSTGDLVLGLAIASAKASLVMAYLMHLKGEKKLVFLIYGMSAFFALCLYFITKMAFGDPIEYLGFLTGGVAN